MQHPGHAGAALAAYAPVALVTTAVGLDELAILGALVAIALSSLPDVDTRLPLVPHRGPTHTVWFTLGVVLVAGSVGWTAGAPAGGTYAIGLAVFGGVVAGLSVASHIVADTLTPMGVRPFAPMSDWWVSFDLTPAANPIANWGGLAIGAGVTLAAFRLGHHLAAAWAAYPG